MKQRIVSLFLLAAFLLLAMPMTLPALADVDPDKAIGEGEAVWDGSTKDASWVDADTYATTTEYHLTTAAQLAGLATLTATYDFSGKTIYLDNDIYLNNISEIVSDTNFTRATNYKWGTSHMIKNFKGTFDGREHAVYGLYVDVSDNGGAGLFMSFGGNSPTIKNLSVKYCQVKNGRAGAGGIVGQMGKGKAVVQNCHVIGIISAGWGFAGGIGGGHPTEYNWAGTISGCSFRGSVTSTGDRDGRYKAAAGAGGITPVIKMTSGSAKATIRDCYVYGNVSTTHTGYAGGIVGLVENSNRSNASILNCGVSGNVNGGKIATDGTSVIAKGVGGIVGYVKTSATVNIQGCYSAATYSVSDASIPVGAVVGTLETSSGAALSLASAYYLLDEAGIATAPVGTQTDAAYQYTETATEITVEEATARASGSLLVRLNEWVSAHAGYISWHIGHHGYPVHETLPADTDYISRFDELENVVTVGTLRGAEIRLTNASSTVLRFTGAVKDSYVASLVAEHTEGGVAPTVEVGTLVMKTSDMEAFNLTPSASYLIENNLVNCPMVQLSFENAKADAQTGTHYWYATSEEQSVSDLSVRHSALSYVKVTESTGETFFYDAPYDSEHNVRSALQIARMAYADRNTEGATVYSAAKFAVIKAYLDHSVYVTATDGGVSIVIDHGEYYANPYAVERLADGTLVLTAPHLTASSKLHLVVNGIRYTDEGSYPNAEFTAEAGKVSVVLRPSESGVASITLAPVRVVAWQDFDLDLTLANKVTKLDATDTDPVTLVWSSSNTDVATVDENGTLTLLSPGTTYIVATTVDGVVSNTVTLEVTPPQNRAADQKMSLPATSTNRIDVAKYLALPTGGYGSAQIAMWKGDAKGAFSITIDDSMEWEFDAWNYASQRNNLPVTFIVPANLAGSDAEFWRKQIAAGQDVQSHSWSHSTNTAMATWSTAQIWMDYYDSIKPIYDVTGQPVEVIGYSYGYGLGEYAGRLFISGRGTAGTPNYGGKIKYQAINSCSMHFYTDITGMMTRARQVYTEGDQYYGGWTNYHFHQIDFSSYTEVDGTEITSESQWLDFWFSYYLQPLRDSRSLWCDTYRNIAKYGQERDTAQLTVESVSDSAISVSIHDQMDDTVFTEALTVKIMVDDTWQDVVATDAQGNEVFAEIVTYDEGTFVYVDVVPDQGTVTVTAVK